MTRPELSPLLAELRRRAERAEGVECERLLRAATFVERLEEDLQTVGSVAEAAGVMPALRQAIDAVLELQKRDPDLLVAVLAGAEKWAEPWAM